MILPSGTCPSRIMIIGEAPSREDLNRGSAFSGSAGWEVQQWLGKAGIAMQECFATTVTREYPPRGDAIWLIPAKKKDITHEHVQYRNRFVHPSVPHGMKYLIEEIERCQPNVILALGNVAMWALTGKWGIGDWRGSELVSDLPLSRPFKVIPTYTPGQLFKMESLRPIIMADIQRMKRESESPEIVRSEYNILIPANIDHATFYLESILRQFSERDTKLAVDIETRNFHIACLGIADKRDRAYVFPIMQVGGDKSYWSLDEETIIVNYLRRILTHPKAEVVGQNFIYDSQHIFRSWHFIPRFVRDTMLAQHCCFLGMQKGLDFISSLYCEHYTFWKNDSKDWDPKLGERQLWNYNGEDCCRTYECDTVLQQVVDQMGLREQHNFQQSMFYPVLRTMIKGIKVDLERKARLISELRKAKEEAQSWLNEIVGRPVNTSSPKQIAELFYEDLGQKEVTNRKTGALTANEEALQKISDRQPLVKPVVQKILELRSINVFLSTFLGEGKGQYHTGLLDIDDKLRCSFNIGGTRTLRFSSDHNAFGTGMNLQNVPKGDEG